MAGATAIDPEKSFEALARKALVGVLVALFALAANPAASADDGEVGKVGQLEIAVSGLENDKGVLIVALLNSADTFEGDSEAFRSVSLPVEDGSATASFDGIPYGSYAAKVYHDENENGKLDTNFVGFPKEGFGFSNDAMGRFGPPTFDQAKFEVAVEQLRIEIHSH